MPFVSSRTIVSSLKSYTSTDKAKNLSRFFKTGKGQYGEGDKFLGIVVPEVRKVAKNYYKQVTLETIQQLIKSPYHEVRLCALIMLVYQFKKADDSSKQQIYTFYLKNTKYINNWDLVDLTAPNIVGDILMRTDSSSLGLTRGSTSTIAPRNHVSLASYPAGSAHRLRPVGESRRLRKTGVLDRSHPELVYPELGRREGSISPILYKLSQSTSLWERRIAILATFAFVRAGRHQEAFAIAELLLHDKHDLIHKAIGWMLREVGKKIGKDTLRGFLDKHASTMPRTTLRYAIEHLSQEEKTKYMYMKPKTRS